MSNNKQSSVEWLFGQFLLYPLPQDKTELFKGDWVDIFEQAKAMHKEEIVTAHSIGLPIEDGVFTAIEKGHKYYDKTFNNHEQ